MLSSKICVVITNYDFSDNADQLKTQFSEYFPTILIDSDSPDPPRLTDIKIENTYYPGLWNAAVAYAGSHDFEWMMFVASDLEIPDVRSLCHCALQASGDETIGVYTPSLREDSRLFFELCLNKPYASMREVGVVEGFFFLARLSILKRLHPLPRYNQYGWGVDIPLSHMSYHLGFLVAVDDRVQIYHPEKKETHQIDDKRATLQSGAYLGAERSRWVENKLAELADQVRVSPGTTALDLGCGGYVKNEFGADQAFGIDIGQSSNPMIKSADLAIEDIPFADQSFDYITAYDFIEHVPRLIYCPNRRYPFVELMNEIYRTLKPRGIFLSLTPAYPDPQAFQDPTHVNIITDATFPSYFCVELLLARMYGFNGKFELIEQTRNGGKLLTLLRAVKDF